MAVMLDKPLKREVTIGAAPYMLTIAPEGLKLVPKGKRIGLELRWEDLVSGQAALAVALNASIERLAERERAPRAAAQATTPPAEPAPVARARRGRSGSADTTTSRRRARPRH